MTCFKTLSVPQMAKRVLSNIPELNYSFVVSRIEKNPNFGLEEISVQDWLFYFDSILIDGQQGRMVFEKEVDCSRN